MTKHKQNLNGHTGFILEKLVLKNSFLFGEHIEFNFTDELDFIKNSGVLPTPYTTILIGPNGTGKSIILKTISDIFLEIDDLNKNRQRHCWEYYQISYYEGSDYFVVQNFNEKTDLKTKRRKYESIININGEIGDAKDVFGPSKLLVNSQLLTDRFSIFKNPPSFYNYLGVRALNSPTTARTRNYIKRTVDYVINSLSELDTGMIDNIRELLRFLHYKDKFGIYYYPKYKQYFLTGNLTSNKFKELFDNYNTEKIGFSKRKTTEYIPHNITYYKNHLANDDGKINELVLFLNELRNNHHLKTEEDSDRMEFFEFDILKNELSLDKYELLKILYSLDLITFPSIRLDKLGNSIDIESASSGEYHFISTMIGIYASILQNSLILIDEPEISLHPNWQMQYLSFLKRIFEKHSSCHFILASHSHFFVSDLEGSTSKIIGLNREKDKIEIVQLPENINTFGWSAEEVLYKIFGVKTSSNYFLEMELRKALHLISEKEKSKEKFDEIVKNLKGLSLTEFDPTKQIIEQVEKYYLEL